MPDEPVDPRIVFAAERTFLAWLRTGLALMGFGFVVARFGILLRGLTASAGATPTTGLSRWFGVALMVMGTALTAASAAQHVSTMRRLARGQSIGARPTWLGLSLAALLLAIGAVMTVYVATQG